MRATLLEKAKELQDKLHAWQKSVGAQMMTVNPDDNVAKHNWRQKESKGSD